MSAVSDTPSMQTAILLFDKVTALDAVGPYEVPRRSKKSTFYTVLTFSIA